MIIKLCEAVDFLDNDFLMKSETPIDLQWKIYRGTLARQSLPIKIYSAFNEQYNRFYELYDKIINNETVYDFGLSTEIDQLGFTLEKLYTDVEGQLNKEARFELKICLEKIVNYLKDLKEKVLHDQYA